MKAPRNGSARGQKASTRPEIVKGFSVKTGEKHQRTASSRSRWRGDNKMAESQTYRSRATIQMT